MNYYNAIAKGYNELHGDEQRRKLALIKQQVKVKKSDSLLDVGCGTGLSSDWDCNVIGIDPSKELLKKNKHKHLLGQAQSLPFLDASFDVVICLTAIHHFDNLKKSLDEIKRVAKKTVIISILKKSKKAKSIKKMIQERFTIKKEIDDMTDLILICAK